jgi:hypothetical protein
MTGDIYYACGLGAEVYCWTIARTAKESKRLAKLDTGAPSWAVLEQSGLYCVRIRIEVLDND